MNLIDSLKQVFSSPDTMSALGQQIGEPPQKVGTALSAAVPALMAALGSLASKPDGARAVMNAVQNNADESMLSQGSDLFRGPGVANLMDKGNGLISSLFGGGTGEGLISLVSRFSGLGSGATKGLMSMVLPLILGHVGKAASNAGVRDAQGLGSFFSSQAGSIAEAMPSGLTQMAENIPGLSSLTDSLRTYAPQGTGSVSTAVSSATSSAGRSAPHAAADLGASTSRVWPVVLLLALIGALAWYLWPRTEEVGPSANKQMATLTDQAKRTGAELTVAGKQAGADVSASAEQAAAKMGGATNTWLGDTTALSDPALAKELTGTFNDLAATLSSVTDSTSVDAAQRSLSTLADRIASWKQTIANLPPEKQAALRSMMQKSIPAAEAAVTKAMAIPGAEEKLRPMADKILQSLKDYSKP